MQLVNSYVKKYVEKVFEDRLRTAGFICPDSKYLCWYRIQGEIINSIVFCTSWSSTPVHLELGYGIHPAFCKPAQSSNAFYANRPLEIEIFCPQLIVENCPINAMNYMCYSSDIHVYAPGRDGRGLYTLEGIVLPKMEGINSIEKSYHHHKEQLMMLYHQHSEITSAALSSVFIDEAIYLDDMDMLPLCKKRIENVIAVRKRLCLEKPDNKRYQLVLHEWEQRRSALFDGTRDQYCNILQKRIMENLKLLQQKINISPNE